MKGRPGERWSKAREVATSSDEAPNFVFWVGFLLGSFPGPPEVRVWLVFVRTLTDDGTRLLR